MGHSTLKTYTFSNARMLRARYAELAYCRMMLQRAMAAGDGRRERLYQEDAEQARRCVEALLNPRRLGVVVYPGIRAELDLWVRLSFGRTVPAVERRQGGPRAEARAGGPPDPGLRCSRCESIGHTVEACPFDIGDEDVRRIAEKRRARRAAEVVSP